MIRILDKQLIVLDYVKKDKSFTYDHGFLHIPKLPGLGIEVNEEYIRQMSKVSHQWKNPIWRDADGSIAEW